MKKLFCLIAFSTLFSAQLNASTYYWVGNGGDWNDYNTHWATTSGGSVFYNHPPTANDDVVFDANSFTMPGQIVRINGGNFFCHHLSSLGVLFSPRFGDINDDAYVTSLKVYGSINFDGSMGVDYGGEISFEAASPNTITGSFHPYRTYFTLNNPLGSWAITDTLRINSVSIKGGTFITNNHPLYVAGFIFQQNLAKSALLGTSYIESSYWSSDAQNVTLDADSAVIRSQNMGITGHQHFNKITLTTPNGTYPTLGGDSCRIDSLIILSGDRFRLEGGGMSLGYFRSDIPIEVTRDYQMHFAEFRNKVDMYTECVFDTLALYNGGCTFNLMSSMTMTINNTILTSTDSCAGFVNIDPTVSTLGPQAIIQLNGPDVILNKVTLKNVTKTGTALLSATNSIDLGNVSNITVTAPVSRTVYWVGGTGNWEDASHWSVSSGGSGGACVPSRVDDAIIDNNSRVSANDTLKIFQVGSACHSLDFSALTDTFYVAGGFALAQDFNIYGSLVFSPFTKVIYNGTLYFRSADTNNVIATGKARLQDVVFVGPGTWDLQDSLVGYRMYHNQGKLRTNGYNLHFQEGYIQAWSDSATFELSTSTYTIDYTGGFTGAYNVIAPQGTLVLNTFSSNGLGGHLMNIGTIKCPNPSAVSLDGGVTIGRFESDTTTSLYLYDSTIVGEAIFHGYSQVGGAHCSFGKIYFLSDFETITNIIADSIFLENPGHVSKLRANWSSNSLSFNYGTCDNYSKLYSDTGATITVSTGIINANNLMLNNINAQGGATFNALNGVDMGNVSGWNFIGNGLDTTYYWVGGTGLWTDANHWSFVSGGVPAGCLPSPFSDVVFDEYSFTGSDTVYTNVSNISVRNMTWHNLTHQIVLYDLNPHFYAPYTPIAINIFGNLQLDSNLVSEYYGVFLRVGNQDKTIATNGVHIKNIIINTERGTKTELLDNMWAENLWHMSGTLYTNNKRLDILGIEIRDSTYMGTSIVQSNGFSCRTDSAGIVADSATFRVGDDFEGSPGNVFGKVEISSASFGWIMGNGYRIKEVFSSNVAELYSPQPNEPVGIRIDKIVSAGDFKAKGLNNSFGFAKFQRNLRVVNGFVMDTLLLDNAGFNMELAADSLLQINNKFSANSANGNNIYIHSSVSGIPSHLVCNGDTVCMEYMSFQDIDATAGTVPVYAGQYSTDISGNTGINFTACVLPFSDVWPGDANSNGVVDNFDLLNIGIAYNETGYVRAGADLSWTAQSCQDWNRIFSNFVNIKHADCDGNGTIDYQDTLAVSQNYQLTHAIIHQPVTGDENQRLIGTSLSLAPASMIVAAGQSVSIPLQLGTSASPATDIYGVAYKLNYDNTKIVPGSISIVYPSSWFTPNNNRLPFTKHFPATGRMENAQSRIDLTNATGNGTIAYLNFQVDPAATGTIAFDLADLGAIDRNGNTILLNGNSVLLQINGIVGIAGAERAQEFMLLYPNPTEGNVSVSYALTVEKTVSIEMYDMLGNKVLAQNAGLQNKGTHTLELKTDALPAGVYQCMFRRGNTTQMSRFVKTK